jgi:uncharacterized membrane protein SirB2
MIEFYPEIKLTHIVTVSSSGGLFLLRAIGTQLEQRWPTAAPVRYLSYSVDTVLLTTAMMLMTILHQFPVVNSWLTVKVTLVIVYIVLGSFALKRARTRAGQLLCTIGAVLVFGMIITIARTHHPLGFFSRWAG